MKRKDELNIEVLSNIKEEIIDKQSAKRYALMNKKRRPGWIIPSSVAAILLVAIMIPLFIVLFSKQVPVYEGMSVLSNYQPSTSEAGGITMLSASGSGRTQIDFLKDDNGNHYGHDKKPVEDIVEDDSSISLTIPEQQMYYAEPNQDVYINIHFSNPDDFVILSFVFNGKTYSSYMFEDGSDMENIIIKCSIGDVEGVVEYTIDAIKYVDGTAIKDVVMAGDRTVKVGVYSADKQPTVQISDELIGIYDVTFTASINDQLELIKMSEGEVLAILCDDAAVISQQKLTLGENNNIKFDGLDKDTAYRYAIVANYDSLDGTGFNTYVLYEKEFATKEVVAFDSVSVSQEGISFTLEWEESFENKVLDSLTLYKGEEKIRELDVNAVSVDGLLSNNEYRLVAMYTNNGETETSDLTFTTQAKSVPEITITENSKTQTSIGFDISVTDVDSVGAITKLELIHGEDAQNIADLNTREFTDLLSNNTYTIKVTYTYDLNDGVGSHTIEKAVNITTQAKAIPNVTVTESGKTQTSIGFDISVTDVDNVGAITKLELIHGEDAQNKADHKTRVYTDLLSNNSYTIKVTYTYDLNDGTDSHTIEKTVNITTQAKAEPIFTFKNIASEIYSISGEYDITNIDNTLISYKVELYRGVELVKENTDKEIAFDSLDYYTDYAVKITYTFDVSDGKGVQEKTAEYTTKTLPYIDVTECSIANTSAVSEGETIFMQVKLDNPLNMTIESVVVNGETYNVTGASTTNRIFVEIVYDGQFAGGDTYLKVDKVNAKIDKTTLSVVPKTELSDNVFINGKLEVLKIEYVNENFEPIDWAFPTEKVYLLITLDNPTGYTVDNIYHNESNPIFDIVKIDNNHLYYAISALDYGWNAHTLSSITYHNEYVEKTLTYSNISALCYKVASDDIVYISTPDDLKNMNDGYYYELSGDIDLSDIEWLGNEFNGVLDGKGYSIQNMSFVGTLKNTNAYIGLFSTANGVIENLNIKETTIIAEITSEDGNDYSAYCGVIIGNSFRSIIRDCDIDRDSIITVKNNTSATTFVGGLVGSTGGNIINCTNNGNITVTGYNIFVGGLAGEGKGTIANCTNSGNLTATSVGGSLIAGGLVGEGGGTIANCTNNGNLTSSCTLNASYTGGLVGRIEYGTIINCHNSGNITTTSSKISVHAGGLVGYHGYGTLTITDSTNIGSISATSIQVYVGGIISQVHNATATITNCTNSGDMNAQHGGMTYGGGIIGEVAEGSAIISGCTNNGAVNGDYGRVGGLVGQINDGTATITDCVNNGSVTSEGDYAGGLVGVIYGGAISNCINNGSVTSKNNWAGGIVSLINGATISDCVNAGDVSTVSGCTGGLAVTVEEGAIITNAYSIVRKNEGYNGSICTIEQLNSKEFYTETLGWDENVWDFSELDYENEKYPMLK